MMFCDLIFIRKIGMGDRASFLRGQCHDILYRLENLKDV